MSSVATARRRRRTSRASLSRTRENRSSRRRWGSRALVPGHRSDWLLRALRLAGLSMVRSPSAEHGGCLRCHQPPQDVMIGAQALFLGQEGDYEVGDRSNR
jgi:hypothetical protein